MKSLTILLVITFGGLLNAQNSELKPSEDYTLDSYIWALQNEYIKEYNTIDVHSRNLSTRGDSLIIEITELVNINSNEVLEFFRSHGGRVNKAFGGQWQGRIQIDSLLTIDYKVFSDYYIKLIHDHESDDDFEGPIVTNSQSYDTGNTSSNAGEGVKIAVIDGSFDGYEFLTTANPPYASSNYTAYDCQGQPCTEITLSDAPDNDHGTRCAEQVYDHAPAAEYRLYDVGSFDNTSAVEGIRHAGVWADIISMSQSKYNVGWNDNDGIICSIIDSLDYYHDFLFFHSSGNRNGSHYQSDFIDDNNFHDFGSIDQIFELDEDDRGSIFLQWDANPMNVDHYDILIEDIFLIDGDCLAGRVSGGISSIGYEELVIDDSDGEDFGTCNVKIKILSKSSIQPEFEFWSHNVGGNYSISSTGNQTSSPGNCTNPNIITVAAVHQDSFVNATTNDVIRSTSSRGPTNDGNFTMELSGPTRCTTNANDSIGLFGGTSCATPNLAGAAAAVSSRYPSMDLLDVRNFMFSMASLYKDWGDVGKDELYGYGGVVLYDFDINNLFLDQEFGNSISSPFNTYFPWYSLEQIQYVTFPDRNIIMLTDDTSIESNVIVDKKFVLRGAKNSNRSFIIE